MARETLKVGLAQIAPAWLQRDATISKVVAWIGDAAARNCDLVAFGEALVPGYPFWVERTEGARFESPLQKELFAHYVQQGVCIEDGDLEPVCAAAAKHGIAVYVGVMERAANRGRHSLYCTMVYIDTSGAIGSAHRKLMPTHEERLVWAIGDGHGLRTHRLGPFTIGGLNCWENWLPLPRAALYAQGEDLHVAIWPGNRRNTEDITRFIARESRSFVVSVSGLMRRNDIDPALPHADLMLETADDLMADGGSCVAAPDGSWVLEPFTGEERLAVVELEHARVLEERHSLDVAGHYARPDVVRLVVDRRRQSTAEFEDTPAAMDMGDQVVAAPDDAVAFLEEATHDKNNPVVVFALEWCEFCWSVRKMFAHYEIPYRSVDLDAVAYQDDNRGGRIRKAIEAQTGQKTIPQIYIGGTHVGGATDLFDGMKDGSVQALLETNNVNWNREADRDPYSFLPKWLQKR